ncbi:MAG: hypothetical protein ACI4VN_05985 [Clostridia bacterium]
MNEFLYKINMIKNHNHIVRLEKENMKNEERMEKLAVGCKSLIAEYQIKNQETLLEMNEKINRLEDENNILRKERDFYSSNLNKVPKIILKMFIGKNKMLGE